MIGGNENAAVHSGINDGVSLGYCEHIRDILSSQLYPLAECHGSPKLHKENDHEVD